VNDAALLEAAGGAAAREGFSLDDRVPTAAVGLTWTLIRS
jgi:hypothetical protein